MEKMKLSLPQLVEQLSYTVSVFNSVDGILRLKFTSKYDKGYTCYINKIDIPDLISRLMRANVSEIEMEIEDCFTKRYHIKNTIHELEYTIEEVDLQNEKIDKELIDLNIVDMDNYSSSKPFTYKNEQYLLVGSMWYGDEKKLSFGKTEERAMQVLGLLPQTNKFFRTDDSEYEILPYKEPVNEKAKAVRNFIEENDISRDDMAYSINCSPFNLYLSEIGEYYNDEPLDRIIKKYNIKIPKRKNNFLQKMLKNINL